MDEYLSPIIFGGMMLSSRVSYQLKLAHATHTGDIRFSIGSLDSDLQPREVTQYVLYVSYSFLHALRAWDIAGRPLQFSLGTGLSSFATVTDFNTVDKFGNYTYSDESWYWSHALNLHLRGKYLLAESRSLSLQLTTPVVRLVSRPENGHDSNSKNAEVRDNYLNAAKQGESEFLWDNLVLLCEIEYRQRLSDHFDLRGAYWFGYASSDKPLAMGMYMNDFLVGILWRF